MCEQSTTWDDFKLGAQSTVSELYMAPATSGADRLIGLAEIKKHTTDKSCWLVVHGNVYDVTDFLEEHPGGYDIILTVTGAFSRPLVRARPHHLRRPPKEMELGVLRLHCSCSQGGTQRKILTRSVIRTRRRHCFKSTRSVALRWGSQCMQVPGPAQSVTINHACAMQTCNQGPPSLHAAQDLSAIHDA